MQPLDLSRTGRSTQDIFGFQAYSPRLKINKMRFSVIMILASAYASGSLGGTLEIIDIDGQCAIWSYDNHGCTGSSAYFGRLEGETCSTEEVRNGTNRYPVHGVEACGMEGNSSAAWIEVEDSGLVKFFNYQGSTSTCAFENGLKHGSRCDATDSESSTKSMSALTTAKSTSKIMESSSTTFQTSSSPSCSNV